MYVDYTESIQRRLCMQTTQHQWLYRSQGVIDYIDHKAQGVSDYTYRPQGVSARVDEQHVNPQISPMIFCRLGEPAMDKKNLLVLHHRVDLHAQIGHLIP